MREVTITPRVMKTVAIGVIAAVVVAVSAAACEDGTPSPQAKEAESRQTSYEQLTARQPATTMKYSPTRETINFWIQRWDKPNKLSYVYLQNADGNVIGYYILKGLPVSYCAALSPTYELRHRGDSGITPVPAPAMDGAYYSGGQCDTYYGRDATTDAYLEWTAGLGINVLLYDQPLPRFDSAKPLGPTTVDDVKE